MHHHCEKNTPMLCGIDHTEKRGRMELEVTIANDDSDKDEWTLHIKSRFRKGPVILEGYNRREVPRLS